MTNAQRCAIAKFRREGYGYKRISQLTGVNENTIKTYCKRNRLGGFATNIGDVCKSCGMPIVQTPGRKVKLFCSDKCRNAWWNSHRDQVNRKANYDFICAGCGKPFIHTSQNT